MFSSDQPLVANQLPISVDFPRDPQEFINTISLLYKRIANAVNTKEGALYLPQELATFQLYFTSNDPQKLRNVYRKVIDFGVIDQSGGVGPYPYTSSQPHGINFTSEFTLTRMYAAATDPVGLIYIPLPWCSPVALSQNISLSATATQILIVTGQNRTNFTRCYVVLEYVKNQ